MRLALAQINTIVGDLDGNRERILPRSPRRASAGADLVLFPELAVTGYPPEDLLLRPGFVRAAEAVARGDRRARRTASSPSSASPHFDRDLYNACAVCADGEVKAVYRKRFLPELRRLRRGPLLRARPRPGPARARRDADRPDDLRGHVAAGPAGDRSRAGRRPAAREHLRVAVPRRQGARARGDVRDTRARQRVLRRLLQRGRRAGRADLRRPLARARRRGRGPRPRARLRGGAARRRRRPGGRDRPPAARRAPPRARARARRPSPECRSCTSARRARRRGIEPLLRRAARASSSRCVSRSSSACATTWTRTASARSSSASRAGSTRR